MMRIDNRLSIVAGLAATVFLASVVTAQKPVDGFNGADAVAVLGDRLPAVARRHGMAPADLAALFQADATLWLLENDRLAYVDTAIPDAEHQPPVEPVALAGIPLEDAFLLDTDPGATRTIYLDFNGHHSVDNDWSHDIDFPAYDTSGDSGTFTDPELAEIIAIWQHVAEDFAPFVVNVTTRDPGLAALTKSSAGDQTYGIRCVMTQATGGFGNGIGGVAFLFSFDDSIDNPVFGFNKGINNGSMTASHEVGHALSLEHDGLGGQTYHPGTGSGLTSWGPIMGAPFNKSLVQWSNGDYPDSTNTQNDLAIMLIYIPPRPDQHGDTPDTATPFLPDCMPSLLQGTIGSPDDVDVFSFTMSAGTVTVSADPTVPGPNLDILLTLYDTAGVEVIAVNLADAIAASISVDLAAGRYFAAVNGIGKPGVYSDYGSLGQYTIMLEPPVGPCSPAELDLAMTFAGLGTWIYDFDLGMYTNIHGAVAALLAAGDFDNDDSNELAMTFTGFGTWIYDGDTETFTQIHPGEAALLTAGDFDNDGSDELAMTFTGFGTWIYDDDSGTYTQLHPAEAALLTAGDFDNDGSDELAMTFVGSGTWIFDFDDFSGSQIHPGKAALLAAGDFDNDGSDELAMTFTGFGTWIYDDDAGTYTNIHSAAAALLAAGDFDNDGSDELAMTFAGFGTWIFDPGAGTYVSIALYFDATSLAAGGVDGDDSDELAVTYPGIGTWIYDGDTGTYENIHSAGAALLTAGNR